MILSKIWILYIDIKKVNVYKVIKGHLKMIFNDFESL